MMLFLFSLSISCGLAMRLLLQCEKDNSFFLDVGRIGVVTSWQIVQ